MPAPFAHFTLFEKAKSKICDSEKQVWLQTAICDYSDFGMLGSNSPDFPIVCLDKVWEGNLHGSTSSNYIRAAIDIIPTFPEEVQSKLIAWFCGYLSHMVGDAVIHPVVNLKVGRYLGHEKEHQLCEIHQDAYIFQELGLAGVGKCDFVKNLIRCCCEVKDATKLDSELVAFWKKITEKAFPNERVPNFNKWFAAYTNVVDKISENGNWYALRNAAEFFGKGQLLQITSEEVEKTYIYSLPLPDGKTINYKPLFTRAVNSTVKIWRLFGECLKGKNSLRKPLSYKWDLNTGEIVNPEYIFWKGNQNDQD